MLKYLKGILIKKLNDSIIIECNGFGFQVYFPSNSFIEIGSKVKLYTELYIKARENDGRFELYGFLNEEDIYLFRALVSVNKVGPKLALAIISHFGTKKTRELIVNSDWKGLSSVSGVGKKTAQKLVIELKERLSKEIGIIDKDLELDDTSYDNDLYLALKSLGFSGNEIRHVIFKNKDRIKDKTLEENIRILLKELKA